MIHRANETESFSSLFQSLRVLFVTRFFPYPPHTGALQYTDDLLIAIAHAASEVTVLCGTDTRHTAANALGIPSNVSFKTFDAKKTNLLRRIFTLSPNATAPFLSLEAKKRAQETIRREPDIVVIDHVGATWAATLVPIRIPIIYCTHNDEYEARLSIARESSSLKSLPHKFDAWRIRRRDSALCSRAVTTTAISRSDCRTISTRYQLTNIRLVHPAWNKPVPKPLDLASAPRNILLLGSLLWQAKRDNLERFLDKNLDEVTHHGIGVVVAGRAEETYLKRMRQRYPSVSFIGEIENERYALEKARVGLIFGEAGGGFRLTTLTFAFHGLPIISPPRLVEDLDLEPNKSFVPSGVTGYFADDIKDVIDELEALDCLRNKARKIALAKFRR